MKQRGERNRTKHQFQKLKNAFRLAREAADTDFLTGAATRAVGTAYLQEAHDKMKGGVALLVLDIDHFKRVNDTLGHLAGDAVLKSVAKVLMANVRKELDSVRRGHHLSRYGGEEFTVALPGCDLIDAAKIAECLRLAVEQSAVSFSHYHEDEIKTDIIKVTISIGVAFTAGDGQMTPASHFQAADAALYCAKIQRNNVVMQGSDGQFYRYEGCAASGDILTLMSSAKEPGKPAPASKRARGRTSKL